MLTKASTTLVSPTPPTRCCKIWLRSSKWQRSAADRRELGCKRAGGERKRAGHAKKLNRRKRQQNAVLIVSRRPTICQAVIRSRSRSDRDLRSRWQRPGSTPPCRQSRKRAPLRPGHGRGPTCAPEGSGCSTWRGCRWQSLAVQCGAVRCDEQGVGGKIRLGCQGAAGLGALRVFREGCQWAAADLSRWRANSTQTPSASCDDEGVHVRVGCLPFFAVPGPQ